MTSHPSLSKRHDPTLAGIFSVAVLSLLLLCGAGSVPIENFAPQGAMQNDLNAGGHSITNAATISGTNVIANALATSVALNGTNLTAGTVGTSALNFTALPPNGAAGGDLSGTFPNPTVTRINGVTPTGLVAGANVVITGTFPNQTISSSGGTSSANVTGIRKSSGAGSTDVAAVPGTDYLAPSAIGSTVQSYNANTTIQGNSTNGANQLVKTDSNALIPFDPHAMMLDGCALEVEGDSISYGYTLSSPTTQCFGYLLSQTPFALNHCTYRNDAVSASTIAAGTNGGNNVTDRYAANVKPHRPSANGGDGGPRAYLLLLIGTNDIGNLGNSATTVITNLTTYISTAEADGFTVIVSTITPRQDTTWTATMEGYRQAVNAAIRSNSVGASMVLDDDHILTDPTNTTYFAADKLHWAAAGHIAIANYIYSSLIAGGNFYVPTEGVTSTPLTAPELTLNGTYDSGSALNITQNIFGYPLTITNNNSSTAAVGAIQLISPTPDLNTGNSLIQYQAGTGGTNNVFSTGIYYVASGSASNYFGINSTVPLFKFYASGAATIPTLNATTVSATSLQCPSILDSNGNEAFGIVPIASSVNYATITDAATGGTPTITFTGSDSTVNGEITTKGGLLYFCGPNFYTGSTGNVHTAALTATGLITGAGFKDSSITSPSSTSITTTSNYRYVCSGASNQTFTLPATCAVGDTVEVIGNGPTSALFTISKASGQAIYFGGGTAYSTVAAGASGDAIRLTCTVANTDWTVTSSEGSFTDTP